jgi:hypothetical protein
VEARIGGSGRTRVIAWNRKKLAMTLLPRGKETIGHHRDGNRFKPSPCACAMPSAWHFNSDSQLPWRETRE